MVQSEEQAPIQEVPRSQVTNRILRATGALMVIQIILRGFGIIEKMIMAYYFGTDDPRVNAYSAARRIAAPVFALGDQVIMHSFLPPFVQRMHERGEKDAWRMASTTINLLALLMALVAIVGVVMTRSLLHVYVPGWLVKHTDLVPLTIGLTRVMVVAMIFLAVSALTYCLLNSYKQFALPASSDLALKGTVLIFAALFVHQWGAYALAIGFAVGAGAKLFVQAFGLRKQLVHYRPVVDVRDPGLKQFALLALPLALGWGFSTLRGVVESQILSHLQSSSGFSALDYAKTICDIPVTFFPYVFGIALFPFIADIAADGDRDRLREMLMTATRMMLLIFIPLAVIFIAFRFPILLGLYGSDKFNEASAMITSGPLIAYAITMLVAALEIVINQFYFAMSDTLRPTVVGMVLLPVHIAVAYCGGILLGWGAVAVALALLVYRSGKVIILYTMIRRKLGSLEFQRTILLLGKILLALIPVVVILLLSLHFLHEPAHAKGKLHKMIALLPYVAAGGIGMLVYLYLLHLLRAEEVTIVINKLRGKLRKSAAPPAPAG